MSSIIGCANGQSGFLHFLEGIEEGAEEALSGETDGAFVGVLGDGFGAALGESFGECSVCLETRPAVTFVVEGTVPM